MNAVAKAIAQNILIEGRQIRLSWYNVRVFFLIAVIMVSALALVYVKDLNRRLFIEYQNLQQSTSELNVQYGKLLLEQGAWSTQGRVQTIAMNSLSMEIPSSNEIVILKKL